MPTVTNVAKVERRERETHFPEELVPTKPVPVPNRHPQGTRVEITLIYFVLHRVMEIKREDGKTTRNTLLATVYKNIT